MPALALVAVLALGCSQAAAGGQSIAFNHKKHVDEQIDCATCHEGVEKEERAGLPQIQTCMVCHQARLGTSAEEAKLIALDEKHAELQWTALTSVPDHVYFSHRRHVTVGKLACATCHGDIASATRPPERGAGLTMKLCQGCHATQADHSAAQRATLDCAACHR